VLRQHFGHGQAGWFTESDESGTPGRGWDSLHSESSKLRFWSDSVAEIEWPDLGLDRHRGHAGRSPPAQSESESETPAAALRRGVAASDG
jgi:hypothetical protein